ncbi:resolvase [Planococcus kocurii]|uniref:Resolvase n=1 Tax=Planococcus kocurii TaxID=1374 RepID=A0ABN4JV04_9BACL|nr:recombinase family protein [Planococcus kocurii]ALS77202.1 resolvase [Planococcus kocurii]
MIIGYARVSTKDQSLDVQVDAITKYALEIGEKVEIFLEKESGGKKNRPELHTALRMARKGDSFVIYKLDRLARSTRQLYEVTDELEKRGVDFVSLNDKIDTKTAAGKAMFGMLAVFAEFERSIIQERTVAGLQAARKRGRIGGRKPLDTKTKRSIKTLYEAGEGAQDIAQRFHIGRSTVYKVLKESNKEEQV